VPTAWVPTLRLSVNTGLVGIIAFLASVYESTKDRMLDYDDLLQALSQSNAELHHTIQRWSWEPVGAHLKRLAEQARALSVRLRGCHVEVEVEADGPRLPPNEWAPFWGSCVHLIRNAIECIPVRATCTMCMAISPISQSSR
jgi:hypothetical protein